LLGGMPNRGSGFVARGVVQRITDADLRARGARTQALAQTAPISGANLWHASHGAAAVYVLGTLHFGNLSQFPQATRQFLVTFLRGNNFDEVYTEVQMAPKQFPNANLTAQGIEANIANLATAEHVAAQAVPANDAKAKRAQKMAAIEANTIRGSETMNLASNVQLDDCYLTLACQGKSVPNFHFETNQTRAAAQQQDALDLLGPAAAYSRTGRFDTDNRIDSGLANFYAGNQSVQFGDRSAEMLAGREPAEIEQRNKQWMDILQGNPPNAQNARQLWIVGADHLSGLILRFQDLGWQVQHKNS
jgi:uncharacterized protein YbaP (TraB family)